MGCNLQIDVPHLRIRRLDGGCAHITLSLTTRLADAVRGFDPARTGALIDAVIGAGRRRENLLAVPKTSEGVAAALRVLADEDPEALDQLIDRARAGDLSDLTRLLEASPDRRSLTGQLRALAARVDGDDALAADAHRLLCGTFLAGAITDLAAVEQQLHAHAAQAGPDQEVFLAGSADGQPLLLSLTLPGRTHWLICAEQADGRILCLTAANDQAPGPPASLAAVTAALDVRRVDEPADVLELAAQLAVAKDGVAQLGGLAMLDLDDGIVGRMLADSAQELTPTAPTVAPVETVSGRYVPALQELGADRDRTNLPGVPPRARYTFTRAAQLRRALQDLGARAPAGGKDRLMDAVCAASARDAARRAGLHHPVFLRAAEGPGDRDILQLEALWTLALGGRFAHPSLEPIGERLRDGAVSCQAVVPASPFAG